MTLQLVNNGIPLCIRGGVLYACAGSGWYRAPSRRPGHGEYIPCTRERQHSPISPTCECISIFSTRLVYIYTNPSFQVRVDAQQSTRHGGPNQVRCRTPLVITALLHDEDSEELMSWIKLVMLARVKILIPESWRSVTVHGRDPWSMPRGDRDYSAPTVVISWLCVWR